MKLGHSFAAAVLAFTASMPAFSAEKVIPGTYQIDPSHSKVGFTVQHMKINDVDGEFSKYEGTVVLDSNFEKSKFSAKIDATSIDTKNDKRNEHLKSPDFFDTAKFPTITFESTKIEKGSKADHYKVTGNLTMHGVTKPETLDVEYKGSAADGFGNEKVGLKATGLINRKDFGISWSKVGDHGALVVSDDVEIKLNIEAGKPLEDKKADAKKPAAK